MQRINTANAVANLFGAGKSGYGPGNPVTGQYATYVSPDALNAIQEEIANTIEGAGIALNSASNAQLLAAINLLIQRQTENFALDTGVSNAYVISLNPAIVAYTDGLTVRLKIVHANTGAATLNAGGGVVGLVNDVGGALVADDLPAGSVIEATYIASANAFYITSVVQSQTLTQVAADLRYASISSGVPPGTIIDFSGSSAPAGYLACPVIPTNISRTTYAALFSVIGTTWGAGDGTTTFGMPFFPADYTSVQAVGNVGSETVGQVISHNHTIGGAAGAYGGTNTGSLITWQNTSGANTGSSGGSANLAAGVRVMKCVKY